MSARLAWGGSTDGRGNPQTPGTSDAERDCRIDLQAHPVRGMALGQRVASVQVNLVSEPDSKSSAEVLPRILRHWRETVPDDRIAHLGRDSSRGLSRGLQMR